MLDLLIEGATVIDGTGAAPRTADVGIAGGVIREVGRVSSPAHQRISAAGAWLTPGFVDLHTHYDGQASWDETFSPSIHHGVTTLLMGNCGVGFAPLRPGDRDRAVQGLVSLMEGVEDIPGVALAEGVRFDWETFPEYMTALDRVPHSLDFLVQVPHDPLRMAVLGDRALAHETATPADIAAMRALLREALAQLRAEERAWLEAHYSGTRTGARVAVAPGMDKHRLYRMRRRLGRALEGPLACAASRARREEER